MLLTVTTTHRPATDLGYLLHKHPDRVHERDLPFGRAYVVYPEASEERCTAALVVDVDPVGLVRGRDGRGGGRRGRGASGPQGQDGSLAQYVNDRPYAASSFLSVAIGKLLGTALGGRSDDRPDLPTTPLPLAVRLPVLPVRGGEPLLRRLFEPLGHAVAATPLPLDATFPAWGDSRYLDVTLTTTACLRDVLEHLFVLLPVLDDDKHYWVGTEEVDKLLRRAGRWLADHPDRELITRRYLRHDRRLATDALARLLADDPGAGDGPDAAALEGRDRAHDEQEAEVERPISLNEQRMAAVVAAVERAGARTVVDLGCGPGQLVGRLLRDTQVARVVGVDVSHRALEVAARRLHLATMTPRQRERVELWQGALTYRDRRLEGFDLATVVEVVEHLDPPRLGAFERALFAHARPRTVVVTTPNVEHNVRFPSLPAGSLRHRDHRFEWTRAEFAAWAAGVAGRHGYGVEHHGIGAEDAEVGPPTQMAVFTR
jgi:3' terminal RNA ribose 2'-O-methyltransferase Hen1